MLYSSVMIAPEAIATIARKIAQKFDPERIILFGSDATGAATADSDVDLLVVMSFEGKPFWKSLEILNRVPPPFAVDLLARQPADTAQRYQLGDPLIRDAIDHGKVLYERGR